MKFLFRVSILILFFSSASQTSAQETLPIFSDYLSDNVYLLHPAAAGIGTCGKVRLTAGRYWEDNELQTLSFHSKLGEDTNASAGVVLFNDKNGFHSQKGVQGTFAYHLDLFRGGEFNQLSFGLSLGAVQNTVDQTTFTGDPTVAQLIESDFYFNGDFGVAYHYGGLSSYFTVKNLFLSAKGNLNDRFEPLNLRNYIFGAGYFFGNEEKFQYEPSVMLQFKEGTSENYLDINMKVYKKLDKAQLWAALSYRRSFDGNPVQEVQQITPILGANVGQWMFSYTYSKQSGSVVFENAGFHQLTVGVNVLCRRPRASACPNINGSF
ncbi:hypothetical protein LPB136_08865 [Tenacibaculum todarodis]|uniref:Type IX secretion system membrane protein PorP/SprF n=1 Tax=Tenacibaculum todarodis TaxID=1850252 RepID=A0A1L3JK38_9FLAO|nr:type IX secretion system membrane protein PorP/SprF [Tenacibaculum todarodis]APG65459.1 hypothetical protein LPB136_08865 [Tenacibaculum todarodis]